MSPLPARPDGRRQKDGSLRSLRSPQAAGRGTVQRAALGRAALAAPARATPTQTLQLQRLGGNRAVQRLLAEARVQPKLMVGAADDTYEREADRVAAQVMRPLSTAGTAGPVAGEEEATVQRQAVAGTITPLVQRHALDTRPQDVEVDEDELRMAERVQRQASGAEEAFAAEPAIESTLQQRAGHGRPLDPRLRGDMETRFGADFGRVQIHTDGEAAHLNRSLSAKAFTHGADIYFGAGQYAPGSAGGQQLLAHELTHVVQQGASGARAGAEQRQISPKRIQRANIPRGQPLPDLNTAIGRRTGAAVTASDRQYDAGFDAKVNRYHVQKLREALADDQVARFIVQQALGQPGLARAAEHIAAMRAAYVPGLATAPDVGAASIRATQEVMRTMPDGGQERVDRLRLVNRAADAAGTKQVAANEYFTSRRGGTQMTQAYLPPDTRTAFATALKQLPIVQQLLNPGQPVDQPAAAPQWRDGGRLRDNVQVKLSAGIPDWLSRYRATHSLEKFRLKLDRVDQWLRALIEPDILQRVPRPRIVMHTRGRMKILGSAGRFFFVPDPTGYRPSAGGGTVDLPFDEVFALMAHEMGHAIEAHLPLKSWHAMNVLLERRHGDKVGASRAARTGATFWTAGLVNVGPLTNEGRYAGRYVTGKYTSTAYDEGNAEVFSQALEFLSSAADARKLIEGDPQHAGIILRAVRPADYRALAALRPFDQYLPVKAGR